MSRSLKKGPFCDIKLKSKATGAKASNSQTAIKTWSRASTILPEFVGIRFAVHNGKNFIDVFVTEEMVGHRLGEFSPSTKFKAHGGKLASNQSSRK
jgi:small subunit ribosomal protein S19